MLKVTVGPEAGGAAPVVEVEAMMAARAVVEKVQEVKEAEEEAEGMVGVVGYEVEVRVVLEV